MTIEIQQSELEELIQRRMASGRFQSVEDMLFQTLEASLQAENAEPISKGKKENLSDFLRQSPLGSQG